MSSTFLSIKLRQAMKRIWNSVSLFRYLRYFHFLRLLVGKCLRIRNLERWKELIYVTLLEVLLGIVSLKSEPSPYSTVALHLRQFFLACVQNPTRPRAPSCEWRGRLYPGYCRLFKVCYFSVRSSRSSAQRHWQPFPFKFSKWGWGVGFYSGGGREARNYIFSRLLLNRSWHLK